MRVPARLAILVNLSIALLAGFGAARLLGRAKTNAMRRTLVTIISATVVVEALPNLYLVHLWKEPPPLYASLGDDSGAVLLEYPMHPHAGYFAENIRYMYFSTWHWTRMVNGYSGVVPDSYHRLAVASDGFPLGDSVAYLQRLGVTHVTLPAAITGSKQLYLKLRDRASYEFALASAAVVISITGQNITRARIAIGGVGTKPWRSPEAEAVLVGQPASGANFRRAAEAALRGAKPQSENGFKIELAKRCLTHALQMAVTG